MTASSLTPRTDRRSTTVRHRFLVLLLAAAACAGGQHPWSSRSLCELPLEGAAPDGDAWLALLLRGFDPETRRATSPAVDCTGAQVRWEAPALLCADATTAKVQLPDRPLSEEDVVVTPLDERHRLVWVVTNRYATGDGLGPAAIVEVKPRKLVVRAIGALRANLVRAKLRLEPLGATEALVAEGESCASADPASCHRAARVMPLFGDRFQPAAVTAPGGGCVGPAWFDLGREESERLASGWRRRTRLDGSLAFGPQGIAVQEQVVIHDVDPRNPSAPPRLFRRADAERLVRFEAQRLVCEEPPLWARVTAARD